MSEPRKLTVDELHDAWSKPPGISDARLFECLAEYHLRLDRAVRELRHLHYLYVHKANIEGRLPEDWPHCECETMNEWRAKHA